MDHDDSFVFFCFEQKKTEGVTSSGDWVLDPVELAKAFSDKTKAIVVNTPNNPLGKVNLSYILVSSLN